MHLTKLLAVVLLGLSVAGCPPNPTEFSCDDRSDPDSAEVCTDYVFDDDGSGRKLEQNKQYCTDVGGTVLAGSCPLTGTMGGCEIDDDDGTRTEWYYNVSLQTVGVYCAGRGEVVMP